MSPAADSSEYPVEDTEWFEIISSRVLIIHWPNALIPTVSSIAISKRYIPILAKIFYKILPQTLVKYCLRQQPMNVQILGRFLLRLGITPQEKAFLIGALHSTTSYNEIQPPCLMYLSPPEIVGYNRDNVWSVVKDIFDCFLYIFYFRPTLATCDFPGPFSSIKEIITEAIACRNSRI